MRNCNEAGALQEPQCNQNERGDDLMAPADLNDPAVKLAIHEAVCAERYASLISRMGRLEKIAIAVAAAVIAGSFSVIFALMKLGA